MYAMTNSTLGMRKAETVQRAGSLQADKSQNERGGIQGRGRVGSDPLTLVAIPSAFPRNHTIYYEGDDADHHYKVVSGTVRLCKVTEDGRRQIAAFLTAGDFFGWTGHDAYHYSAEAVTDVVLEKYQRRGIEESVASDPKTRHRVLALLCDQLTSAHDHLLLLGRMTASERIAAFLMELAGRQGETAAADRTVALPMTRKDIADYLGLTIETVSRTMSTMRRNGLISFDDAASVQLRRCDTLERMAQAA